MALAEPLVDHDCQGVLVAGGKGIAQTQFRSRVPRRASYPLPMAGPLPQERYPKVSEQHLVVPSEQDVFWFDVAANQVTLVRILQGSGDLLHIGNNLGRRWTSATWITLSQGAVRGIFHDEKGRVRSRGYAKILDPDDMRIL